MSVETDTFSRNPKLYDLRSIAVRRANVSGAGWQTDCRHRTESLSVLLVDLGEDVSALFLFSGNTSEAIFSS